MNEFPVTPELWFTVVGTVLVGAGVGIASYLIQLLVQLAIPYLGEEESGKLAKSLNILMALLLPVGVGYGLVAVMQQMGLPVESAWDFVVSIATAVVVSQGWYEMRRARKWK